MKKPLLLAMLIISMAISHATVSLLLEALLFAKGDLGRLHWNMEKDDQAYNDILKDNVKTAVSFPLGCH